jgi:hypothetical protein
MSYGKSFLNLFESYVSIRKKQPKKVIELPHYIEKLLFILDQISNIEEEKEILSSHNDLLYLLSILDEEKDEILILYEAYCAERDDSFTKLTNTMNENKSLKSEIEFLINQLELNKNKSEISKPIRLDITKMKEVGND